MRPTLAATGNPMKLCYGEGYLDQPDILEPLNNFVNCKTYSDFLLHGEIRKKSCLH